MREADLLPIGWFDEELIEEEVIVVQVIPRVVMAPPTPAGRE